MFALKLFLLFFIGCSSSVAGTLGPKNHSLNLSVPNENHFWELGGHALYLQPYSSNYAYIQQIYDTSADNSSSSISGISPKYNWGFQFEAAHSFGKGKDTNLNWYHFRGTTNTSYPAYYDAPQFIQQNSAWDHVNLEYGNLVNLEETTAIRFHAGLVYARVATDYIKNHPYLNNNNNNSKINTVYSGFGTRAGMSLIYHAIPHFNLHGDIAAGILAGTIKTSEYSDYGDYNTLDTYSSGAAAPEIDAKAGLEYKVDTKNGKLNLDAGWLWATYINSEFSAATGSFGIQGLYFGARWNSDLL